MLSWPSAGAIVVVCLIVFGLPALAVGVVIGLLF